MELFAIVTLYFGKIWTYFTSIYYTTLFVGVFGRSKRWTRLQIGSNFTHEIVLNNNLTLHLDESMTHE